LLLYVQIGAMAVGTVILWAWMLLGLGYMAWLIGASIWHVITH